MEKGVDTGPIILKRNIGAQAGEDFSVIRERLEVLMVRLMLEGIRGLRDGTLSPQPQKAAQGRQYYVMHPRIKTYAELKLDNIEK
jgi:methionyl-tRNA formyltransferase